MTEEFLKKMQKANEKAISAYKELEEKDLEEYKKNKEYAGLYAELVLSFIEVYDYKNNSFNINSIEKDLSEIIGKPRDITTFIDKKTQLASICLNYKRNKNLDFVGLPEFIRTDKINFKIVNEMLRENGISVTPSYWNGGEESNAYLVEFDASMLITTRKSLLEESEKVKKKILSI